MSTLHHRSKSGSQSPAPGSPGGKAAPSPPAVVRHESTSSTSSGSGSSTPTVSSPLNPNPVPSRSASRHEAKSHSLSPHTTPTRAPVPLPPTSPGSIQPFDIVRRPSPLSTGPSEAIPITRVRSSPLPIPLEPRSRHISSFFRSREPSPARTVVPAETEKEEKAAEDERPAFEPVVSWWQSHGRQPRPWTEGPQRKRTVPVEQTEGYRLTRQHVAKAVSSVLDVTKIIAHEALFVGVDLLRLAPVPMLEVAGMTLINIWISLENVEACAIPRNLCVAPADDEHGQMNRLACLRLTERCAQILLSVREEITDAPPHVAEELQLPVTRLESAFEQVHVLLQHQAHRPFLKRYLKRDEIQRSIDFCNSELSDALNMFGMSIQIRTLKLIQINELRRRKQADLLFDELGLTNFSTATDESGVPEPVTPTRDPREVERLLSRLRREQNAHDRARDLADLRQLMRTALQTNNDAAMIEVLQIGRDEMPEAIKTLQRELEHEIERERGAGTDEDSTSSSSGEVFHARGRPRAMTITVGSLGLPVVATPSEEAAPRLAGADTLDREFLEGGIEALRRLSQGTDIALPSWTITRYEVDIEAKIGLGFFSDVYRARWRGHVVAVKVLAETTPKAMFVREMGIWKALEHPNVLELLGASSATSEPPWFFVSPYYKNGSLVTYLKCLDAGAPVDMLKMMNQIARGMAYLHKQDVLHGDLKGANVLVDDSLHCVISDFGQSEMKSEVVRLSGASPA
ncbi:hypothetical protein K488DRAFT_73843, partial [Vararia minispora EC-137]